MSNTKITRAEIESLYDRVAVENSVSDAILHATLSLPCFIKFLSRYANLNAWFGSGVASLSGNIGRSRGIFVDPDESIEDIADRGVLVASYFFDAARDEFDDRDTKHRDTHRCLVQASIKGSIFFFFGGKSGKSEEKIISDVNAQSGFLNEELRLPIWMEEIGARVSDGYGVSTSSSSASIFRAMGYHIGSEILADLEFSMLDSALRDRLPDLQKYLKDSEFKIADTMHNGYAWFELHSSHGSAKETEHFESAVRGVEEALRFVEPHHRDALRHQVHLGIGSFVRDHQEFFANVSTP